MKYIVKAIQPGKIPASNVVTPGTGIAGQPLVLKAVDGTRLVVTDVVSNVSPKQLKLVRHGKDLHIALPGGDPALPDIIVQDYYAVAGTSLQGLNAGGNWQVYDTASLPGDSAGAFGATAAPAPAVALGGESGSLAGLTDNPWLLGGVALGGIGIAAAAGGGGGGGGSSSTPSAAETALQTLKNFTADSAAIGSKSATTPTASTYTDAGIKAFASLSDTTDGSRVALTSAQVAIVNTALDKLDPAILTRDKVQAMVDSYYRILKEADGSATTNPDVYPDTASTADNDPLLSDYTNIGINIADAIGTGTNGGVHHTLNLLNSAVGQLASTAVDTAAEIQALATTANDVMFLAKNSSATQSDAELVINLNSLLGHSSVTAGNIQTVKADIIATANDGSGVDSIDELQKIVSQIRINDFAVNSANSAPLLNDYQAFNSKATSTNLNAYNDAVNNKAGNSFTDAETSALVDSYNIVLAMADGNHTTVPTTGASALDYGNIGLTPGTYAGGQSTTVTLLNSVISGLTTDKVDTVGELRNIESAIGKVLNMAANTKVAGATTADYKGLTQYDLGLLGLKGNDNALISTNNMTGAELAYFNDHVIYSSDIGTDVSSFDKLQTMITNAIIVA